MAAEVAPQSQQGLEVGVLAEEDGRVSGWPQQAAAAGGPEQQEQEDACVGRKRVMKMEALRDVLEGGAHHSCMSFFLAGLFDSFF